MALDINDLTYQQLYNTTLARIKAICYNIDSNRLPAELQSGYDEILEKVGDTEHHAKDDYEVPLVIETWIVKQDHQQHQGDTEHHDGGCSKKRIDPQQSGFSDTSTRRR